MLFYSLEQLKVYGAARELLPELPTTLADLHALKESHADLVSREAELEAELEGIGIALEWPDQDGSRTMLERVRDAACAETQVVASHRRVAELEGKLSAAVGECAKAKDDLANLEAETQWSEGTLIVDGREVGIRMRGSMFVLNEAREPFAVTSKEGGA